MKQNSSRMKGGACMQALLLFLTIFFGIFGAAVFVRIAYDAAIRMIIKGNRQKKAQRQKKKTWGLE